MLKFCTHLDFFQYRWSNKAGKAGGRGRGGERRRGREGGGNAVHHREAGQGGWQLAHLQTWRVQGLEVRSHVQVFCPFFSVDSLSAVLFLLEPLEQSPNLYYCHIQQGSASSVMGESPRMTSFDKICTNCEALFICVSSFSGTRECNRASGIKMTVALVI